MATLPSRTQSTTRVAHTARATAKPRTCSLSDLEANPQRAIRDSPLELRDSAVAYACPTKAAGGAMNKGAIGVVLAFGVLLLWVMGRKLWMLSQRRSDYDLGFKGERVVGEELNEVIRDGGYVFHDFPADPKWNIDHVVVTSAGVFSIETKTRRKRKAMAGQKDYEVVYDGKAMIFPHCSDAHGLQQAKDNARWLSHWLSKAVGDQVLVTPILTLPGWWVVRRSNNGVKVLNPKEIRSVVCGNTSAPLSAQMITRIVHQLDQKCRDVEF